MIISNSERIKIDMEKIVHTVMVTYFILLCDFTADFKTTKGAVKVEYNGLLWVILDYWSIWKYKSIDKPTKWIKITRT